jgi:hypothetical protein
MMCDCVDIVRFLFQIQTTTPVVSTAEASLIKLVGRRERESKEKKIGELSRVDSL